jgi:tRNA pseudouridine38-40 synthase
MEEKKNIRFILAYDGSRYHGWQRQKNGESIQGVIEDQLYQITRENIRVIASGRTDAGVHALNQICHFNTSTKIEPQTLQKGLNSLLPHDIFIKQADYVPLDFHARYSARSKIYEYRIINQPEPDIFLRFYSWHIQRRLNLDEMKKCLSSLIGEHDFSAFKSTGSENKDPVRKMLRAEIENTSQGRVNFLFEANGFLRHMVRNVVGTMVEVGLGKLGYTDFLDIFESKDRCQAGIKAPPQGLFLVDVKY